MTDNAIFGKNCRWRETMQIPRVGIFDFRIIPMVFILFLHLRVWTILLVIVSAMFFYIIEYYRLPFPSALRFFRSWLAGPFRPGRPMGRLRMPINYGFPEALSPAAPFKRAAITGSKFQTDRQTNSATELGQKSDPVRRLLKFVGL